MRTFWLILQILSGIALIIAVLMHTAKGEGLGGIGGTAHIFGSQKGLEEGLNKITTIIAVIFILSSIFVMYS